MAPTEAKREYVSWTDVQEHTRWLERGFVGRLVLKMVVACPKGEQQTKQYYEYVWCDDALQERPTNRRILGRYPNAGSKSVAGLLLGMLFEMEAVLSESYQWVEPTIGAPSAVAGT